MSPRGAQAPERVQPHQLGWAPGSANGRFRSGARAFTCLSSKPPLAALNRGYLLLVKNRLPQSPVRGIAEMPQAYAEQTQ